MAVNVDRTPDGKGIILFNGEMVLLFTKEVNIDLTSADAIVRGKKKGSLYLTSHRVVFTTKDSKDPLQSLSIPFQCFKNLSLEQPVLGANYMSGTLVAQPNASWSGEAKLKLTFNQGGCIEFGQTLLRASEITATIRATMAPPPYAPPAGGFFSPPPAYYTYQGTNFHGVPVPAHAFPNQPQSGTVYMYQAAPPFPGVYNPPPVTADSYLPPNVVTGVPPPYSMVAGQQDIHNNNQREASNVVDPKPPSYENAIRHRHPPK